jgi:hypothetical protein
VPGVNKEQHSISGTAYRPQGEATRLFKLGSRRRPRQAIALNSRCLLVCGGAPLEYRYDRWSDMGAAVRRGKIPRAFLFEIMPPTTCFPATSGDANLLWEGRLHSPLANE